MKILTNTGVMPYGDTLRLLLPDGKRRTRVGVSIDPGVLDVEAPDLGLVETDADIYTYKLVCPGYALPADERRICLAREDDRALVFYFASHSRLRIQPARSIVAKMLVCGCYGAGVIALMRPGNSLIFKHRCYEERATFANDTIEVDTRRINGVT